MNKNLSDYILGFLACDGFLDKNGITFGVAVQARDKIVLDLFCDRFGGKIEGPRIIKGREYLRARHYSKSHWDWLIGYFGGRLKEQRFWPQEATPSFVAGCLDADGSFGLHHGYPAGEFQHASAAFRKGLVACLAQFSIPATERRDRPVICFSTTACRKLARLWPDGALTRKQEIAAFVPPPDKRWWTPEESAWLRDNYTKLSNTHLARIIGKSETAVALKAWREGYVKTPRTCS